MDEFEKLKTIQRIAVALEAIAVELHTMNNEGLTIFGGSTMEEN